MHIKKYNFLCTICEGKIDGDIVWYSTHRGNRMAHSVCIEQYFNSGSTQMSLFDIEVYGRA